MENYTNGLELSAKALVPVIGALIADELVSMRRDASSDFLRSFN